VLKHHPLLTLQMPGGVYFDLYKYVYMLQPTTSVGVLPELRTEERFRKILPAFEFLGELCDLTAKASTSGVPKCTS
jgi:hypothetical protein